MRKIFFRLTVLLFILSGMFLINDGSVRAMAFSCVTDMFDAQIACDDSFSDTTYNYYDLTNNSPNLCNAQAQSQCANSPDPNCYSNVYNSCYTATAYSYNHRYSTYGDCVDATINYGCHEQPDFCGAARSRASQCSGIYPDTSDLSAYIDCYNASGVGYCE